MAMVFCRGRAKELHETALGCPHCGASQHVPASDTSTLPGASPWMAITSMVLGILCLLALFDDSQWSHETVVGVGLFAMAGLVLGVISTTRKKAGQSMAITGIVLSAISLVCILGI
ncbi:DUF4190 domain-containing protein [Pseudomonas putida]